MSFSIASASTPTGGDRFNKAANKGSLVGFTGRTQERIATDYGNDPAAVCEAIINFDTGELWTDQIIWGKALVPQICADPEVDFKIGRLEVGIAKPGMSAPYLLDEPTTADLEKAADFLNRYATRHPDGHIELDAGAYRNDQRDNETPF